MRSLKSWIVSILACHLVLVNTKRLGADDAENTVKIAALITVTLPAMVLLWIGVALLSNTLTTESITVSAGAALLVIIFGVSSVTDRIYDRNTLEIQQRADKIKYDPLQGKPWVRRRLFKIYLGNLGAAIVLITLIKILLP